MFLSSMDISLPLSIPPFVTETTPLPRRLFYYGSSLPSAMLGTVALNARVW